MDSTVSTIDPTLPLQIGDVAILSDLKQFEYNGREVIVEEFLADKKRFKVRLHPSGKILSVRAKNAKYNPFVSDIPENIKSLVKQSTRTCECAKQVSEIQNLIEELQPLKAYPDLYATVLQSVSTTLNAITTNTRLRNWMLSILKEALNLELSERTSVGVKIQLAKIYNHLGQTPKTRKLLSQHKKRHFGRLPEIIAVLTQNNATDRRILIDSYAEIQSILESGNYDHHFGKVSTGFYASVAQAACHSLPSPDIELLRSLPEKLNQSDDPVHLSGGHMVRGHVAFAERKFEQALESFTRAREIDASLFGEMGMRNAVFYQTLCFVELGAKSQAQALLKKLKRMKYGKANLKPLEKMIKRIRVDKKVKTSVKVKSKCSNPFCAKVEEKKLQFKKCGLCRAMTYCSVECLHEHWENGHKRECKPVKV